MLNCTKTRMPSGVSSIQDQGKSLFLKLTWGMRRNSGLNLPQKALSSFKDLFFNLSQVGACCLWGFILVSLSTCASGRRFIFFTDCGGSGGCNACAPPAGRVVLYCCLLLPFFGLCSVDWRSSVISFYVVSHVSPNSQLTVWADGGKLDPQKS